MFIVRAGCQVPRYAEDAISNVESARGIAALVGNHGDFVAVTREASAGGKIRFWVAEADGAGKHTDATTQRLKLSLLPKLESTGRSPYIAGQAGERER